MNTYIPCICETGSIYKKKFPSIPADLSNRLFTAALGFYGNESSKGHQRTKGDVDAGSEYSSDGEAEFKVQLGKWRTDSKDDQVGGVGVMGVGVGWWVWVWGDGCGGVRV